MTPADLRVTRYDVDQGVALVTLNRPDRLNAWTGLMEREYRACLAAADADPDVRVVVVTGAGRGFCAGADYDGLSGMALDGAYDDGQRGVPLPAIGSGLREDFNQRHTFPLGLAKPLIAAVNGPAAGVGFVLMCFADVRFAARGAKLTTSFARLGLPAEHGVSWMLSRIVGVAHAADLLLSSRVLLAEEAVDLGLVNRVFDLADLLPASLDYARAMASECSPLALKTIKRQLYDDLLGDLGPSAAKALRLLEEMVAGPEFAEGVAAWLARRPPHFTGVTGASPN
jgi:enoyl-CoA hydratase/carnithine racemase